MQTTLRCYWREKPKKRKFDEKGISITPKKTKSIPKIPVVVKSKSTPDKVEKRAKPIVLVDDEQPPAPKRIAVAPAVTPKLSPGNDLMRTMQNDMFDALEWYSNIRSRVES